MDRCYNIISIFELKVWNTFQGQSTLAQKHLILTWKGCSEGSFHFTVSLETAHFSYQIGTKIAILWIERGKNGILQGRKVSDLYTFLKELTSGSNSLREM